MEMGKRQFFTETCDSIAVNICIGVIKVLGGLPMVLEMWPKKISP